MKTDVLRTDRVPEQNAPQTPSRLVEEVVDQVRRDAVTKSQEYLDETTVPHGGE